MASAAAHILRVLEEAGIRFIFGVPGGGTMAIYSASRDRPELRPFLVRQEHGAAIMADAYARASGRPAVIMGQGPFIGSLGSFGLMEALTSSSPVIVIGDTSDHGMGPHPVAQCVTGEYGTPDLVGLLRAVTKHTSLATTPKEAVIGAQLAVKYALAGNPGPAGLVLRTAAIAGEVDESRPPFIHAGSGYLVSPPAGADAAAVAAAADLLAAAERPVLVAGKGVHNAGAHDELRRLAEALAMPVVTSYKGLSAIADTHPLAMGMIGTYGRPSANATIAAADLVLVVGAKLTSADTAGESLIDRRRQRMVQVDVEPRNAGWAYAPDVALIGDARAVLDQLLGATPGRDPAALEAVVKELHGRRADDPVFNDPASTSESSPVMPQRLVRLLEGSLDPASNVVLDAGFNRIWTGLFFRVQRANSFFAPGGMAGMGWALPGALGVKLARPEQPAVAVTGDGGFMMSVHALATAVEHELPFTCVVMNDSGLGMVRHHQENPVASTFGATDHAAIARGFGAHGIRVDDSRDLPAALEEAQASGRPAVVDVITDQTPSPDVFRARTLTATET